MGAVPTNGILTSAKLAVRRSRTARGRARGGRGETDPPSYKVAIRLSRRSLSGLSAVIKGSLHRSQIPDSEHECTTQSTSRYVKKV